MITDGNSDPRLSQIEDYLEKLYYFLPPITELDQDKLLN